jgi:hypothetical protein
MRVVLHSEIPQSPLYTHETVSLITDNNTVQKHNEFAHFARIVCPLQSKPSTSSLTEKNSEDNYPANLIKYTTMISGL